MWAYLKKRLPEETCAQVKRMTMLKDGTGAVFDVPTALAEEFIKLGTTSGASRARAATLPPPAPPPPAERAVDVAEPVSAPHLPALQISLSIATELPELVQREMERGSFGSPGGAAAPLRLLRQPWLAPLCGPKPAETSKC